MSSSPSYWIYVNTILFPTGNIKFATEVRNYISEIFRVPFAPMYLVIEILIPPLLLLSSATVYSVQFHLFMSRNIFEAHIKSA